MKNKTRRVYVISASDGVFEKEYVIPHYDWLMNFVVFWLGARYSKIEVYKKWIKK